MLCPWGWDMGHDLYTPAYFASSKGNSQALLINFLYSEIEGNRPVYTSDEFGPKNVNSYLKNVSL